MRKNPSGYFLYLMRHGIATERGSAEFSDEALPLTAEGKKKLQQIVVGLTRIGVELDWIVTSPLVRAEQTAQVVASSLRTKAPLDTCDALRPGGSVPELEAFLTVHPERSRILLVGHEPDLSGLAAHLTGADRHANLAFKKGGCCLIEWQDAPFESEGQLVWWLTPRLLRVIAEGD